MEHCAGKCGIFCNGRFVAYAVHISRAGKHSLDIQPEHRRRQKSYRAKFGKSSADTVGNIESFIIVLFCKFDKVALDLIGRSNDIFRRFCTEHFFENIVDDQILRHRFARRAGFRDHVKASLFRLDHIQKSCHSFGIDVVFHIEFGSLSLGRSKVIIMQMAKRIEYGDRTERAAADTEHDKIFKFTANFFRGSNNILYDLFLVIRKFCPAEHTLAAVFKYVIKRIRRHLFHLVEFCVFEAVIPDKLLHHVVVINGYAHAVAPVFIPEIHIVPPFMISM